MTIANVCSVESCNNSTYCLQTMCRKHYTRWLYHNDAEYRQKQLGYRKKYREANRDIINDREKGKYKERKRNNSLKTKYGITTLQFNEILTSQDGVCAICKKPETTLTRYGETQALSLDHCHTSNNNRGLLCSLCNFGIGCFKDDISLLISASEYLKLYQ